MVECVVYCMPSVVLVQPDGHIMSLYIREDQAYNLGETEKKVTLDRQMHIPKARKGTVSSRRHASTNESLSRDGNGAIHDADTDNWQHRWSNVT